MPNLGGSAEPTGELDSLWADYMHVAVEYEAEEEDSDRDMVQEDEGEDEIEDVDAYCLQRKISQAYEQQIDPQQCQKLAEEVLKILAEGDYHEVEANLLVLLQFEKFSLIRFLLRNRLKIVSCTRLARSEDSKKIEEETEQLLPAKEMQKNLEKSIEQLKLNT